MSLAGASGLIFSDGAEHFGTRGDLNSLCQPKGK